MCSQQIFCVGYVFRNGQMDVKSKGLICLACSFLFQTALKENVSTQVSNRESRLRYTRWTSRGQWTGQSVGSESGEGREGDKPQTESAQLSILRRQFPCPRNRAASRRRSHVHLTYLAPRERGREHGHGRVGGDCSGGLIRIVWTVPTISSS